VQVAAERPPGPPPHFLLVGAPRSGTTWLAGKLAAHPDLYVPLAKELYFFDGHWNRGIDWYRRQFLDAGGRLAGEATPLYLAGDRAAERMGQVVPDARLLAVLREPVSRAWSHYWHRRAWGRERRPFAEAVDDELAGVPLDLDARYLAVGRYHDQLERLTRHFPRQAIQVALFDDLKEQPDQVLEDICAFLGVALAWPADEPETRNASYALRWYAFHHFMWLRGIYPRLPARLAIRLHKLNERAVPPLDVELGRRLHDLFAEDNARLASWLDRELPW